MTGLRMSIITSQSPMLKRIPLARFVEPLASCTSTTDQKAPYRK
jgi:hypothetical protein